MAAKRIYQLAKEFERDEKEIIEFLTSQGIKVANRLSAVTEDTYNLLKAKYTAPPEPEPVPEPEPEPAPEPEPVVEQPAQVEPIDVAAEQVAPGKKKKKKKKKSPQADGATADQISDEEQPVTAENLAEGTQDVYNEAIAAGNAFISDYNSLTKKQRKAAKPRLTRITDTWGVLNDLKFDYPDTSPARYWFAMNKLTTCAFKLINEYGLSHREILAELRNLVNPLGKAYEPIEILSEEENKRFADQQDALFRKFGHGMGLVNDQLYALKMHAERMKAKYELNNLVDYVTNPDNELRCKDRVPFAEVVDAITFEISGIARRVDFYCDNKERITESIQNFFAWRDGYVKLKEQGAPAEKLEKYLYLEQKLFELIEFMAFDNLVYIKKKNKPMPFDILLEQLNIYRDNMDDPDAERNFKYKTRGLLNIIYKPKEYIFLFQFAELEVQKDYRPPEEIAAAQAKAAAEAEAAAQAEDSPEKTESPAANDEA
ncbi:MAG: translation initiation factor IF-2 N-terminal domain-containing protein [Selenomonadaceae bacterium]|nr:translation initiation factor IF-2 N-terminal domain-containing protein [Selenomonadaceae bacterium]